MSNLISPRPRVLGVVKRVFPIVASQFNQVYVQGLVDHFTAELRAIAPAASLTLHQVPGAFEIPVVVRELASQKRGDAIIAVGVILKGETNHAENLSRSVTDALQRVAVTHGVPVINAVLSFDNETHARERCLEDEINRGTEAARAAVEIANVMSKLRNK
jgi:6,7-dimethyl-8-ribityllumazine synthase